MCWGISGAILGQQKQKAHNHMGCRLHNGDGGSSLKRVSIHVEYAISIVISMFTLSNQLCVKC